MIQRYNKYFPQAVTTSKIAEEMEIRMNTALDILKTFREQSLPINEYVKLYIKKNQKTQKVTQMTQSQTLVKSRINTLTPGIKDEYESQMDKDNQTVKFMDLISLDDQEFLMEVCCGVIQNQKMLDDLAHLLLAHNTKLRLSSMDLYYILFFETIFHGDDFNNIKQLLQTQQPPVVMPFLRFVWGDCRQSSVYNPISDQNSSMYKVANNIHETAELQPEIKDVLLNYFEEPHVTGLLTKNIVTICAKPAQEYTERLASAYEQMLAKPPVEMVAARSVTKFDTFNVTKRNEVSDSDEAEGPIHENLVYQTPELERYPIDPKIYEQKYEDVITERVEQIRAKAKPTIVPDERFERLAHKQQSEKTKQMIKESEKSLLVPYKVKPPPKYDASLPPIKANKNQILRENALLEKKLLQQEQQMKDYMAGLRDSSEFDAWKAREEAKEKAERETEIELMKLRMRAAKQQMRDAVAVLQAEKAKAVQEDQAENLQRVVELMEKQQAELEEMRSKNQEMHEQLNKQVAEAKEALLKEKKKQANQVNKKLKEDFKELKERREIEQVEKQNLIKQLKAMLEVQSAKRVEYMMGRYDPSSTNGIGLLAEMSLTELRERILQMKEYKLKQLEDKRKQIEEEKKKQEAELQAKAQRLQKVKAAIAAAKTQKRLGNDVFQDIIEQMRQYSEERIQDFHEQAEKRRNVILQQKDNLVGKKDEIKATVSNLKDKLKALKAQGNGAQNIHTKADNSSLNTTRLTTADHQKTKRAATIYNQVQKDRMQQKMQEQNKELKQKEEERARIQKDDEQRKREQFQTARAQLEQRRHQNALKDPYKAKLATMWQKNSQRPQSTQQSKVGSMVSPSEEEQVIYQGEEIAQMIPAEEQQG